MNVIILGSGRVGTRLALMMAEAKCNVTVVDWAEDAFARLPDDFGGATVFGNGVDQDVLREAGIENTDVFIAATSGDNRNIMASQIAKEVFHVPRVISRIKDPIRADIYRTLGIEVECRTIEASNAVLELLETMA